MGFLNLSAWRSVGGRRTAEAPGHRGQRPAPRATTTNLDQFQTTIDAFFEEEGRRPQDVAELYLWQLQREGAIENETRGAVARDLFSYYDIEPNSLLGMVAINQTTPAGRSSWRHGT